MSVSASVGMERVTVAASLQGDERLNLKRRWRGPCFHQERVNVAASLQARG